MMKPTKTNIIDDGLFPEIDTVVLCKCSSNWQIKKDALRFWNITYQIAASARYVINDKEYELTAGDLLCLPPAYVRQASTNSEHPMQYFSLVFNLKNISGNPARLPFRLIEHIGVHKALLHLFHELLFAWNSRQDGYIIKTRAFLMLILHQISELTSYKTDLSNGDFRIIKVIRHIQTYYAEKITVKSMAMLAHLNTDYFGVLFKQETGMTLNQYLMRTRVENAKTMLQTGDFKVSEVAERCGYFDESYFYKQFKKNYGFPPSDCIPQKNVF